MKYEKSCGSIIIDDEKVLIITQNDGVVGFPKGHMEKGETEEETAIRETKEETNIDVEINNKYRFKTNYIVNEKINKDVVYFLAKPLNDNIIKQDEEIQSIKWVNINEVIHLLQYDNIKELWKDVLKTIKLK